jgi:hypothetical protein
MTTTPDPEPPGSTPSRLTGMDRHIIARARKLAAVPADSDANCEFTGEADADHARALMLGEAKHLLGELAAIAERLGGTDG